MIGTAINLYKGGAHAQLSCNNVAAAALPLTRRWRPPLHCTSRGQRSRVQWSLVWARLRRPSDNMLPMPCTKRAQKQADTRLKSLLTSRLASWLSGSLALMRTASLQKIDNKSKRELLSHLPMLLADNNCSGSWSSRNNSSSRSSCSRSCSRHSHCCWQ